MPGHGRVLRRIGLDGVVAKRLEGAYQPGKCAMLKIKVLNVSKKDLLREITIVVSEQVLSFAMDVADRLFVIEGGRLVHETTRANTDAAHIKQFLSV